MIRWLLVGSTCSMVALASCDASETAIVTVCARPGIPSVITDIRDAEGQPTAIGAIVTITGHDGFEASGEGYGDSLRVAVGESRGGTFDIVATKPWHSPAELKSVKVPEDKCGVEAPTHVALTLPLLPNAPPVRQVVASPGGYGFGWGNLQVTLVAFVEAAPGVSTEVQWSSRDTSVAVVTPGGVLTSRCRDAFGRTWIVAASVPDPSVQDSVRVGVFADQDPARCP